VSDIPAGAHGADEPAADETAQVATPTQDDPGGPPPAEDKAAEDKANEQPPPETVEEAIKRLMEESNKARAAKEEADNRFADADRRLTALRNLKLDIDKAKQAYTAAYDQLKRDQTAYADYLTSETDSLEKSLKPAGVQEVKQKADDVKDKEDKLRHTVETRKDALETAVKDRDSSKGSVKDQADLVNKYKQLAATVSARHAKLKSMRDEITKARQARQYALAYWLLTFGDYDTTLHAKPTPIPPDDLPVALLSAVNKLTDYENRLAANEIAVVKRQQEATEAEKQLDEHLATAKADLRKELEQLQTPTTGDTYA
jgi:hypothetical protein